MANRGRQKRKTAARKAKQKPKAQPRQYHRLTPNPPMSIFGGAMLGLAAGLMAAKKPEFVKRNPPIQTIFDDYGGVWKEPDTEQEYQHREPGPGEPNADVND